MKYRRQWGEGPTRARVDVAKEEREGGAQRSRVVGRFRLFFRRPRRRAPVFSARAFHLKEGAERREKKKASSISDTARQTLLAILFRVVFHLYNM